MRFTDRRRAVAIAAYLWIVVAGAVGSAPIAGAQNDRRMGPMSGMPQMTLETPAFYRQSAVVVFVGIALLAGFAAYRVIQARWGSPVRASSEAVLVVDLVESTHLATHWATRWRCARETH